MDHISKTIYLKDYISPGMEDCAPAFRAALADCIRLGADVLQLEAGIYSLKDSLSHTTTSIAHDDGCGDISQKDCHLLLQGVDGFTIRGAVKDDGSPDTLIAGFNDGEIQQLQPGILWVEGCDNLTLENLAFTRMPECVCTGEVTAVCDGSITVSTASPTARDGMAAYCMNRISADGKLTGASLTYGFGFDQRWEQTGAQEYSLLAPDAAKQVQLGESLVWHQVGRTDFLLFFGGCVNLSLSNIRIFNTNSFGILTETCKGITAKRLVIMPEEGRFFTGPRDGWKIYRCSGDISLDACHIEGVRMDGQNVHSNYLRVEEVLGERTALFSCKYAPLPLQSGSLLRLYRPDQAGFETMNIASWDIASSRMEYNEAREDDTAGLPVPGKANRVNVYRIRGEAAANLYKGQLCMAECWQPASYTCTNSVFRNIAGAGHLLRCGNITISRCRYENIMNAGILMGAELSTHSECGHVENAHISDNEFINCGFHPRYGRYGMAAVSVKSQGFNARVNSGIYITGNTVVDCAVPFEIYDASKVVIKDNIIEIR